jgi:hypothetical protein
MHQTPTQPTSLSIRLVVLPTSFGWKLLGLGMITLSNLAMTGCQGFGRRMSDDMAFLSDDEDDWSTPAGIESKRGSGRVPRPDFSAFRKRAPIIQSGSTDRAQAANNPRSPKTPSVVGYGQPSERVASSKNHEAMADTNNQDVDVDSALATLPPHYRDILKKQLAVVQQKNSDGSLLAMQASSHEGHKNAPELPTQSNRAIDSAQDIVLMNVDEMRTGLQSNATNGSAESKKGGVSFRMTDSSVASTSPPTNEVNAAAKTEPSTLAVSSTIAPSAGNSPVGVVSHTSQTDSSKVVLASSTDVGSNPSNMISHGVALGYSPSNNSNWRQNVGIAIEQLEKQIKETPSTDDSLRLSQELTLRMLYVSQRRLEDALRRIDQLSDSEQEYVKNQMLALYEASNPDAMPVRSRHWSLVMNSQREATNHLAAASNLEVKSLAFCTEVERYGVVTKFPKSHFQADQEVLLYCEIENVSAEKVRSGFETQLQGSYEIIDSQGRKIADQLLPMEPELCQNHRRDYFIVYKIYMPQQIASGNYQLRLTIEDMKARKFGQSQLDFSIKK